MTDLIQRLRADADSCPVGDQYTADLEREAADELEHACDRLRAALERIAAVRYGLESHDTDEEAMRYWFTLCQEYRRIAREALRK